jgi:hypothetical protein
MDRASAAEIPNAPWSRPSWSSLANDPYVAEGPAPGVGLAHRTAGTRVFTASASVARASNAERDLARPATEKLHPATATELLVAELLVAAAGARSLVSPAHAHLAV